MFLDHAEISSRLNRTLYYGKPPKTERPSLPLTSVAVELFTNAVPDSLDAIDMDFAAALSKKARVSPCSMILALVYLRRLQQTDPEYLLQVSSSHLFIVSMMVASKFLYDEGEEEEVYNEDWGAWASIDVKELNQIERDFLAAVDWRVYVNAGKFHRVLHDLEGHIAWREGVSRGWFSYTDVVALQNRIQPSKMWNLLFDTVVKVVLVSTVAYTVCVLAIVGAVIATDRILHSNQSPATTPEDSVLPTRNRVSDIPPSPNALAKVEDSWENLTTLNSDPRACYSCLCIVRSETRELLRANPMFLSASRVPLKCGDETPDVNGSSLYPNHLSTVQKAINMPVATVFR